MNEDDKELLILDLCARQPHGIRAYCKDGDCDVNVLIEHMWCALRAVWRNVEKNINEQNMRISFYDTKLTKYSKKLNI